MAPLMRQKDRKSPNCELFSLTVSVIAAASQTMDTRSLAIRKFGTVPMPWMASTIADSHRPRSLKQGLTNHRQGASHRDLQSFSTQQSRLRWRGMQQGHVQGLAGWLDAVQQLLECLA